MLSHLIIALAGQIGVGVIVGDWISGAAFGAALFIGREHAQAEYRWIESFGMGRRANMPWWGGFDPRVWRKADAWADWALPLALVAAAAAAQQLT